MIFYQIAMNSPWNSKRSKQENYRYLKSWKSYRSLHVFKNLSTAPITWPSIKTRVVSVCDHNSPPPFYENKKCPWDDEHFIPQFPRVKPNTRILSAFCSTIPSYVRTGKGGIYVQIFFFTLLENVEKKSMIFCMIPERIELN